MATASELSNGSATASRAPLRLPVATTTKSPLRRILVTVDVVAFGAAWLLVLGVAGALKLELRLLLMAAAAAAGVVLNALQSLFTTSGNARGAIVRQRIARAALGSAVAMYFVLPRELDERVLVAAFGATAAFLFATFGRLCFNAWLDRCRAAGRYLRPVLVVGRREGAAEIFELLTRSPGLGLHPCGVVGPDLDAGTDDAPWLGLTSNARNAAADTGATGAIVVANGLASGELRDVVSALTDANVHVLLSNGLLGVEYRRLQPVPMAHEPFVYVQRQLPGRAQLAAKRAIDIALASIGLVLTAPVLAIAAVAIKIEDRGPVFFRQRRVGLMGREFMVHKLRTMIVDAESRLDDVRHLNERHGPLFKILDDPRETRVGRFLRRSSIDELPQLIDVLRGNMSLVGPRPALPCEVELFDEQLRHRVRVRPGVTGLWQLESRDNPSFDNFRRLDLFYVENWTLGLDVTILAGTVPLVISRCFRLVFRERPARERSLEPMHATPEPAEIAS